MFAHSVELLPHLVGVVLRVLLRIHLPDLHDKMASTSWASRKPSPLTSWSEKKVLGLNSSLGIRPSPPKPPPTAVCFRGDGRAVLPMARLHLVVLSLRLFALFGCHVGQRLAISQLLLHLVFLEVLASLCVHSPSLWSPRGSASGGLGARKCGLVVT